MIQYNPRQTVVTCGLGSAITIEGFQPRDDDEDHVGWLWLREGRAPTGEELARPVALFRQEGVLIEVADPEHLTAMINAMTRLRDVMTADRERPAVRPKLALVEKACKPPGSQD